MSDKQKDNGGVYDGTLPEETGAVVIDMQEKLMMAMNETKACEEKCCNASERPSGAVDSDGDRSAVYKGTGPHIAVTL